MLGIGAELGLVVSILGEGGGVRDVLDTGWWMTSVDILGSASAVMKCAPTASVDFGATGPSDSDVQVHAIELFL